MYPHCLFLVLILLLALPVRRIDAKRIYSQIDETSSRQKTIATTIPCRDTTQCRSLSGNAFCQPELICLENLCHQITETPCATRTQTCDEANRRCVAKTCATDADCSDNIFCNGKEKCIESVCRISNKLPCPGHCNETLDRCDNDEDASAATTTAPRRAHWRKADDQEVIAATNTSGGIVGPAEGQIWIGYVIAAMVMVIFFVLVMLMIALVNRNYLPIPVDGAQWMY